ncbi:S8 family serine peptidase [bacterium]|nr:S8 family serine peptidase [bacterium]
MKRAILLFLLLGLVFIVGGFFLGQNALAYRLENTDDVRKILNEGVDCQGMDYSALKIAIIDEGFPGYSRYKKALGRKLKVYNTLTEVVEVAPGSDVDKGANSDIDKGEQQPEVEIIEQPADFESAGHGFAMAQVMMASSCALTLPEAKRPMIYLIPVRSFDTYEKAVNFLIKQKVDIALHSINIDWSSNFDGGGFINTLVSKATRNGVIWVNSAGNNGKVTYHSDIFQVVGSLQKGEVHLPHDNETLMFENFNDDNQLKITLTWNDFKSDIGYGTSKDLDIRLYRVGAGGKLNRVKESIGQGEKRQIGRQAQDAEEAQTSTGNAFEQIRGLVLQKGYYAIKVFLKSDLRDWSMDDEFRIILSSDQPESVEVLNSINRLNSEITPPADNPSVVTVGVMGAPFSAQGYTKDRRRKPDVWLSVDPREHGSRYSNASKQLKPIDTSDAAALVAGSILNMKAMDRNLSNENVFSYIRKLKQQQGNPRDVIWQSPQMR